jgi:hypothetical protein
MWFIMHLTIKQRYVINLLLQEIYKQKDIIKVFSYSNN